MINEALISDITALIQENNQLYNILDEIKELVSHCATHSEYEGCVKEIRELLKEANI